MVLDGEQRMEGSVGDNGARARFIDSAAAPLSLPRLGASLIACHSPSNFYLFIYLSLSIA